MRQYKGRCPPQDDFMTYTEEGGVTVATVQGCALVDRQAGAFHDRLAELAERSGGRLAVCLSKVESVSWPCARELCRVQARCRDAGGTLIIYGASSQARSAMRASGALGWLTVVDDRAEAVRKLQKTRLAESRFAFKTEPGGGEAKAA